MFALLSSGGTSAVYQIVYISLTVISAAGLPPAFRSSAVSQSGPGAFLGGMRLIRFLIQFMLGMLAS